LASTQYPENDGLNIVRFGSSCIACTSPVRRINPKPPFVPHDASSGAPLRDNAAMSRIELSPSADATRGPGSGSGHATSPRVGRSRRGMRNGRSKGRRGSATSTRAHATSPTPVVQAGDGRRTPVQRASDHPNRSRRSTQPRRSWSRSSFGLTLPTVRCPGWAHWRALAPNEKKLASE